MRLIDIKQDQEPECLKELRASNKTYSALQGNCLAKVRDLLKTQQRGRCAYCDQKFKSTVFIEHYLSQEENNDQCLMFSNFLGVCSGKFYLDKNTGRHIEHCDTSRKSITLRINPKVQDHINTIFYDKTGKIRSTNPDFDTDINDTLNLNFKELLNARNQEFKRHFDNLVKLAINLNLSKKETYERGLNAVVNSKTVDFPSYLTYRYQKLLEGISE